jgi:hypothetical protein
VTLDEMSRSFLASAVSAVLLTVQAHAGLPGKKMLNSMNNLQQYFRQIATQSKVLVEPHLIAIYKEVSGIQQVGTGFLVNLRGCPVLITAKHTLYGNKGNENPLDKKILVGRALTRLGDLVSHDVAADPNHDVAALCVSEYQLDHCFSSSSLMFLKATQAS